MTWVKTFPKPRQMYNWVSSFRVIVQSHDLLNLGPFVFPPLREFLTNTSLKKLTEGGVCDGGGT